MDVDASPAVEVALETAGETDARSDPPADVGDRITSILGVNGMEAISGLGSYRYQLEAIVRNEGYGFNDTAEIVEAAIVWLLTARSGSFYPSVLSRAESSWSFR